MTLIQAGLNIENSAVHQDPGGRSVIIEVVDESEIIVIANIYGPNSDHPEFFLEQFQVIAEHENTSIMVMGDFNIALNPEIDRTENVQYRPQACKTLLHYVEEFNLMDIWRVKNPDSRIYSWVRKKTKHSTEITGSRLDYALISIDLANRVETCNYEYGYKTDHSLFSIVIEKNKHKRGPGYWKFNKLLLHDKIFVEKVNNIIAQSEQEHILATPDKKWECCKDSMISWAKERSIIIARNKK